MFAVGDHFFALGQIKFFARPIDPISDSIRNIGRSRGAQANHSGRIHIEIRIMQSNEMVIRSGVAEFFATVNAAGDY